ncbi:hypothetical protein RND71_043618 [Anisodus tanguticus]|uniref:Trehalase n=1 Tax=Anisodus tanguticus TaxID=243964 RepID=A0AAE1QPS7_9SOLA|nr:hypothetical protein RND71_043618 [Anisodus tanguticus]
MGPELAWNMYEATRIVDNNEFTVFFFDKRTAERPQKPKRKELVVEVLRKGYANLFQVQHNCPFTPANQNNVHTLNLNVTSKFLQIVHKLEETEDTLAFAVEPLFGSLANITGYLQRRLGKNVPSILKDYSFLEYEVKYGFTQLSATIEKLKPCLNQLSQPIQNLLERDFRRRPSIQELLANKYFDDSGIQALQFLDMNIIRDVQQKNKFYQGLPAMMHLVPKALVTILENIELFLEKSNENDLKNDILPIILNAFNSNSEIQFQSVSETLQAMLTLVTSSQRSKISIDSSPTTTENMSIAKAASSSNLSGRRFSSISPEDLAEFQANRKDRKNSSSNLDLGFSMNKRRHSSINPNDLKNMANKVTRAADDLIMSTTEKITDTKKYPGLGMTLDFPLTGLNTKRNRRSSVSVFLGQNSILPSSGGSSGSKLFQKFSTKKPKKPQSTSQKILQHIESGMIYTEENCNTIQCKGKLFETIQMKRIFDDSKVFVDMATRYSPEKIIESFEELPANISNIQLKEWVKENFYDVAYELDIVKPDDWVDDPNVILKQRNEQLLELVTECNKRWLDLVRQYNESKLTEESVSTFIPVKNPFVIPGSRFTEFYYWDSYWVVEGLLASQMIDTAANFIQNFVDIINKLNYMPNGSRTYYLNRSQPPFLMKMISAYYEHTSDNKFIFESLRALDREYDFFMKHRSTEINLKGYKHRLNLYKANTEEARPESYFEDTEFAEVFDDEKKKDFFMNLASAAESEKRLRSRSADPSRRFKKTDIFFNNQISTVDEIPNASTEYKKSFAWPKNQLCEDKTLKKRCEFTHAAGLTSKESAANQQAHAIQNSNGSTSIVIEPIDYARTTGSATNLASVNIEQEYRPLTAMALVDSELAKKISSSISSQTSSKIESQVNKSVTLTNINDFANQNDKIKKHDRNFMYCEKIGQKDSSSKDKNNNSTSLYMSQNDEKLLLEKLNNLSHDQLMNEKKVVISNREQTTEMNDSKKIPKKTEYKAKFKPFSTYVYISGKGWFKPKTEKKENAQSRNNVDEIDSLIKNKGEVWYKEVLERNLKANEFRSRSEFGNPILGRSSLEEVYKKASGNNWHASIGPKTLSQLQQMRSSNSAFLPYDQHKKKQLEKKPKSTPSKSTSSIRAVSVPPKNKKNSISNLGTSKTDSVQPSKVWIKPKNNEENSCTNEKKVQRPNQNSENGRESPPMIESRPVRHTDVKSPEQLVSIKSPPPENWLVQVENEPIDWKNTTNNLTSTSNLYNNLMNEFNPTSINNNNFMS